MAATMYVDDQRVDSSHIQYTVQDKVGTQRPYLGFSNARHIIHLVEHQERSWSSYKTL